MFFKNFLGGLPENTEIIRGSTLKRTFCIILFVLTCLCFSGCNENNFPTAAYGDLNKTISSADMALTKSNIVDKIGFRKVMHSLAYTIDKERHYEVTLLYEDLERGICSIPILKSEARRMNKDEYRRRLEANLIIDTISVLNSDETTSSDHGSILGVVLEWKTKDLLGKVTNYAICDFDANGTWDYGAKSDNDTLDMSFSSYSSKEDCPKREINKYYTSYLSSDEEIITLEDLSGSETMEDFEQLL